MSSNIDTLLQAALYLELQEQRRSHELSPTNEVRYQYHDNYFDNQIIRNRNNSRNLNNQHQAASPPPGSPVIPILNGISNHYNGSNSNSSSHHDFSDCSTVIAGTGSLHHNARINKDGRIVEPCSNGHSNTTSHTMFPANSQHQSIIENDMHYTKTDSVPIKINNNNNGVINNNNNNNNNNNKTIINNNNNNDNNDNNDNDNNDNNDTINDNNNKNITDLSRSLPTPLSMISNFDDNNRINHLNNNNNNNNNNAISNLSSYTTPTIHSRKKCMPLTPPPIASRKLFETSRIRSFSLSSNKITAANSNGTSSTSLSAATATATTTTTIIQNGTNSHNAVLSSTTEDSSQSSLNLSTSGYLSGGSANSSVGGCTSVLSLNGPSLSSSSSISSSSLSLTTTPTTTHSNNNLINNITEQNNLINGQQPTTGGGSGGNGSGSGRRRTISSNSNGAGTREVHNKLEKYRRAHLKECFEQLKVHLDFPKDEEKKKTSNLAILAAAYRHVMALKTKERELEQIEDRLANDKVNAQKKIISLKRELGAKNVNIDFSSIISDAEVGNIPVERVSETLNDSVSLSSGRGSMRYSSSSSLSSGGNTVSSPLGIQTGAIPSTTLSPVINSSSVFSSGASPSSSPNMKSLSPLSNSVPLSLTARNISATSLTRGSPTPSTPSPSPSSSGVSSSSSMISTSPPISIGLKVPNIPNGVKYNSAVNGGGGIGLSQTTASTISIVSSSGNSQCSGINSLISSPVINITSSETKNSVTTTNGMPLHFNGSSQNLRILPNTTKDFVGGGKNGVCRKASSLSESRDTLSPSSSHVLLASGGKHGNFSCVKDMSMDDGEHPPKVIKVFNSIALASVDKETKILSSAQMPVSTPLPLSASTPFSLSQVLNGCGLVVSPLTMANSSSHQGFNVINTNGVATIELSSATSHMPSQSRVHTIHTSSSPSVTSASGAQLHKLLVGGTGTTSNVSGSMTQHSNASVASELGRLPGGAEVNILPTASNGTTTLYRANGKLAIVNNGLTLKGVDHMNNGTGRSVHVVTPLHSNTNSLTGLTPIVVSQGQQGNNLAHLIASSPQLAGKVNLSVGGQTLPLLNTQYLGPMKPMVVTVANNSNPTLSSVPPTRTSANIVTGTTNGNTL